MSEIYKSEMMPTDIVFTNRLWAATEAGIIVDASQIGGSNIHNGMSEGSLEQINYDNANFPDSEYKDKYGELNAKASGFGSVAFGGLRYGYQKYKIYQTLINDDNASTKWEGYYRINDDTKEETGSITNITNTSNKITLNITPQDKLISSGTTINGYIIEYTLNDDNSIKTMTISGQNIQIINEPYAGRTPTSAEGNQSFAAGGSVHAHGDFSVAFGKDNDAHQKGGFVTGGGCRVGMTEEEFNAFYWDAVNNIPLNDGKGKNADGKITDFENKSYEQSYSFGFTSGTINKALGRDSFATGLGTQALGRSSFASGMGSNALGSESFAAGNNTYATGSMSAAFGYGVDESEKKEYGIRGATGKCSFVAGRSANATGDFSQAFGYFTQATGLSSFAAGNNTEATGKYSVSLGNGTKAIGDGSVALGYNSQAKGLYSFAMGDENTIVEGNYSSAFGRGLRTSPKCNSGQHIIGSWNDLNYLELMAFAVGDGSDDNNRKNLLSLYKDGRLRLPNVTGTLTDNDVTRLKDVKNLITEATTEIDRKFEALDSDFFNSIY